MKLALFLALCVLVAAQTLVYCAPVPYTATDVVFSSYVSMQGSVVDSGGILSLITSLCTRR